jgi:hypothetical protein
VTRSTYYLCVYDEVGGAPVLVRSISLPPGGVCNGFPCWRQKSYGFLYKAASGVRPGLRKVLLKAGADGRSKITITGKGAALALPPLPLTVDGHVQIQLSNSAGACWSATFPSPAHSNTASLFSATSE